MKLNRGDVVLTRFPHASGRNDDREARKTIAWTPEQSQHKAIREHSGSGIQAPRN